MAPCQGAGGLRVVRGVRGVRGDRGEEDDHPGQGGLVMVRA